METPDKVIPKPPFRLMVVSRSQTGKTTLIVKLMYRYWIDIFDKIFLFVPTYREDNIWRLFDADIDRNIIVETKLSEARVKAKWIYCRKEQQKALAKGNRLQFLFFFDDCGGETGFNVTKPSGVLNQLAIKGNHTGISCIYIIQKVTLASTTMRLNSEAMLCFYVMQENELKAIYAEFGTGTFKDFKKFLQYYTQEPYHFLFVNRQGPGKPRYYHNFVRITHVP